MNVSLPVPPVMVEPASFEVIVSPRLLPVTVCALVPVSVLLAGGGVKVGITYGQTDEIGATVAADLCHVHDFHATILHLLGIDHTRLIYRHAGRDFRLTDVHGNVVTKILD